MGRSYCFVPGCKTGYTSERKSAKMEGKRIASLFVPPQDDQLFDKWKKAIPRADKELTRADCVCEHHFLEDDVEKFFITKLYDGSCNKLERERPFLKSGAIPTVFPNLPAYLSKAPVKSKLPASRNLVSKRARDNSAGWITEAATNLDIGENSNSALLEGLEFNEISESISALKLPSDLWSITSTAEFIIFAKWNKQYTCEKRIVIEKDLTVKVYIQTREVYSTNTVKLTCMQDVSSLVLKVDSYVACAGVDDKTMSSCVAYLPDHSQFGERLGIWCQECRSIKKQQANSAQQNNTERITYCHKTTYKRLTSAKRKTTTLQQKIHAQSAPSDVQEQAESGLPDEFVVPNLDIVKEEPIEYAEENLPSTSHDFIAVQSLTNFTLSLKAEPNDDCVDGMKILVHPDSNLESSSTSHACTDNAEPPAKKPNISPNPLTIKTESKDEFHVFGDFVATKLRSFIDKRLQVEAQHRITNMLFEMEMKDLNGDSLPVISKISSLQKNISATVTLSSSSNVSRNPGL